VKMCVRRTRGGAVNLCRTGATCDDEAAICAPEQNPPRSVCTRRCEGEYVRSNVQRKTVHNHIPSACLSLFEKYTLKRGSSAYPRSGRAGAAPEHGKTARAGYARRRHIFDMIAGVTNNLHRERASKRRSSDRLLPPLSKPECQHSGAPSPRG